MSSAQNGHVFMVVPVSQLPETNRCFAFANSSSERMPSSRSWASFAISSLLPVCTSSVTRLSTPSPSDLLAAHARRGQVFLVAALSTAPRPQRIALGGAMARRHARGRDLSGAGNRSSAVDQCAASGTPRTRVSGKPRLAPPAPRAAAWGRTTFNPTVKGRK